MPIWLTLNTLTYCGDHPQQWVGVGGGFATLHWGDIAPPGDERHGDAHTMRLPTFLMAPTWVPPEGGVCKTPQYVAIAKGKSNETARVGGAHASPMPALMGMVVTTPTSSRSKRELTCKISFPESGKQGEHQVVAKAPSPEGMLPPTAKDDGSRQRDGSGD